MSATALAERLATVATRRRIAARVAGLDPRLTLRDELDEWQAEHRDRPLWHAANGAAWSATDLAGRAARWARWTILHDARPGEAIALLYPDRPERFAALLGVASAACVTALLDPAAEPEVLAATIAALAPRRLVVDASLLPRFEAAAHHLGHACAVWVDGPHAMAYPRLDEALADLSPERLRPADRRPIAAESEALRVAASPEAAARPGLSHRAAVAGPHAAAAALKLTTADRIHLGPVSRFTAEALLAPALSAASGALAAWPAETNAPASPRPTIRLVDTCDDLGPAAANPPRALLALGHGGAAPRPKSAPPAIVWADGRLETATGRDLWRDDARP